MHLHTCGGKLQILRCRKIHIVYRNYLQNSLKRHERLRRTAKVEAIEFVNLSRQSPVSF